MTDYYKASTRAKKLHTDDTCYLLNQDNSKGFREVDREHFPDLEVCPHCSGDIERKNYQDRSAYDALRKAGGLIESD